MFTILEMVLMCTMEPCPIGKATLSVRKSDYEWGFQYCTRNHSSLHSITRNRDENDDVILTIKCDDDVAPLSA